MKKWLLWTLICILCLAILLFADRWIRNSGLETGMEKKNSGFYFLIQKQIDKILTI